MSELASNAVTPTHTAAAPRLGPALSDEHLHVEVTDSGPGFSPPLHPCPSEDGGFGLYLLDAAADRWGVESGERCRVWFELDRAAPAA